MPDNELSTSIGSKARFDDLLEIPSDCFIGRELAIDTVSLWMTHDTLLPAAGFSDDLFG